MAADSESKKLKTQPTPAKAFDLAIIFNYLEQYNARVPRLCMIEACRKLEAESGSSNRTFGVVMAAFFTLVLLWRYATGNGLHLGLALCAGIFLFLALLLPASLTLPNKAWTKLGLLMHSIVGPIALGVVFYLAITPTAFLMKLFGKPPLSLAYSNETSYWIKRTTPPLDMKKQF